MGLHDIVQNNKSRTKEKKEKLHNEELCPVCGEPGEETGRYYWRCTTDRDKCDVITYIPTSYELQIDI